MNKKLILFMVITVFAFSLAIYQYVKEFQSEFASAAYSQKPAAGHSWSEMECSEGFCVTSDNKVGIGTSAPGQKLEVAGSILASGAGADICTSSGACLSQIVSFVSSQPLLNTTHNYSACTSAGGEIVSIGASYPVCRFNAASCPSGWTQYQNWATYDSHYVGGIPCSNGCTGGGSPWGNLASNNPTFSCVYVQAGICWGSDGEFAYTASWSGDSVRSQIGCY
ncbi:MAG: hypothetical protein PHH21_00240 [Candidatus Pacebacteria bacterium]|nr:hypothetical protein [Candidatus Paceibacterota bacterium]